MIKSRLKIIANRLDIAMQNRFAKINEQPIFILGNDKSGTTVIAATLAKATGKSVALDIPPIWNPTQLEIYDDVDQHRAFIKRNKFYFSKDLIKEPVLTFEYKTLKAIFPEAKFILIVRDPFQNIRSILNRLNLPGDVSDLKQLNLDFDSRFWKSWETVLKSDWLGDKSANFIASMAYRWNWIIENYISNKGDIILVRYEDFKSDKNAFIEMLAEKLELPVINDFNKIAAKQFQSKGKQVDLHTFFKEENYALIDSITYKSRQIVGYS